MFTQFFRIYRPSERREYLFNIAHIWKIEVRYSIDGPDGKSFEITPMDASKNPEARRWYIVHVGDEIVRLLSDPGDPVVDAIEEIYKSAIKGRE